MRVKDIIYIIFIMLVTWVFSVSLGKTFSDIDYKKELYQERIKSCKKETDNLIIIFGNDMSYCEYLLSTVEKEYTFYDVYTEFLENFRTTYNIIIIQIVMVISLVLEILSKLKYSYPEYYLVRKSYRSFIFSIVKSILKVALVIPVALLLSYLLIGIYSNFNFNSSDYIDIYFTNKGNIAYLVLNLLNIVLLFGVYVNICLLVCRKKMNSILSIIMTLLYSVIVELFLVFIVDKLIINKILGIESTFIYFNILATFSYLENSFIYKEVLSSLLYFVLSLIPVMFAYRNKEKLVRE